MQVRVAHGRARAAARRELDERGEGAERGREEAHSEWPTPPARGRHRDGVQLPPRARVKYLDSGVDGAPVARAATREADAHEQRPRHVERERPAHVRARQPSDGGGRSAAAAVCWTGWKN